MRSVLIALTMLGVSLAAQEKPALGLWMMNEGSGTVIRNAAGPLDGTLKDPGMTKWIQGPDGPALLFGNGWKTPKNAWIALPLPKDFQAEKGFTVLVTVRTPETFPAKQRGRQYEIVNYTPGLTHVKGFRLVMAWGSFWFHLGDGKTLWRVEPKGSRLKIQPLTWYRIAAVYDGNTARLYVDGELHAEKSDIKIIPAVKQLSVGAAKGKYYGFSGVICDLRFYGHPLPEQQIREYSLDE